VAALIPSELERRLVELPKAAKTPKLSELPFRTSDVFEIWCLELTLCCSSARVLLQHVYDAPAAAHIPAAQRKICPSACSNRVNPYAILACHALTQCSVWVWNTSDSHHSCIVVARC
jgi:hypothetical protein